MLYGSFFEHAPNYITDHFHNRSDLARDVIRLEEARFLIKENIQPQNTIERKKGSITMDNLNYGRYMGEIQITKVDLPSDQRVNVIGSIREDNLDLLLLIDAGRSLMIKECSDGFGKADNGKTKRKNNAT